MVIREKRTLTGRCRALMLASATAGLMLGAAGLTAADQITVQNADGTLTTMEVSGPESRVREVPIGLDSMRYLTITTRGRVIQDITYYSDGSEPREVDTRGSGCSETDVYTNANFEGGSFNIQAGFVETEIAAASYTHPPAEWPLTFRSAEMIFATSSAMVETTTEWSILIWEGQPNNGTLVETYSSDGTILPHIILPPGTNGVNVQVIVDPGDPDQVILNNNGSNKYSVGFRIDAHHNPPISTCPCPLIGTLPAVCCPPSTQSNAFPTTDIGGVANPANNWLFARSCPGAGGLCGVAAAGWYNFSTPGLPSGDWVLRATVEIFDCVPGVGACCFPDGSCQVLTSGECNSFGGFYQGDNTNCNVDAQGFTICDDIVQGCCFPGGGCSTLTARNCSLAGGDPLGPGSDCNDPCNPMGACCTPDGMCAVMSPEDCQAAQGFYQGNNTVCGQMPCPDPVGACCFSTGFCFPQTEAECMQAPGAMWAGPGVACAPNNECPEVSEPCPGDATGDDLVDINDLNVVLGNFGTMGAPGGPGDVNEDGNVDIQDLNTVLGNFGNAC